MGLAPHVTRKALRDQKCGAFDAVVEDGSVPVGVGYEALLLFFGREAIRGDLVHQPTRFHFRGTETAPVDTRGVKESQTEHGRINWYDVTMQYEVRDLRKKEQVQLNAEMEQENSD